MAMTCGISDSSTLKITSISSINTGKRILYDQTIFRFFTKHLSRFQKYFRIRL